MTLQDFLDHAALSLDAMKWLTAACAQLVDRNDAELIREVRRETGYKPRLLARADYLFHDAIDTATDYWTVYRAWRCAEVKDTQGALDLFNEAMAIGFGRETLDRKIREANAAPKGKPMPEHLRALAIIIQQIPRLRAPEVAWLIKNIHETDLATRFDAFKQKGKPK